MCSFLTLAFCNDMVGISQAAKRNEHDGAKKTGRWIVKREFEQTKLSGISE